MPHKTLHVLKSGDANFAGPARILLRLARMMDREDWKFHAALLQGAGPIAEELQRAGVTTEVIGWSGDRSDLAGAWRFFRYLQRERFCIVHQHFGGISGRIMARAAGVRGIVLHLHSRVVESAGSGTVTYDCRVADKVIATSQAVASCARRRAEVVYPGVTDLRQSPANPSSVFTVGTAARLVPLKGIAYLVEAIARIRTEFPIRLEIAGDGPERVALEEQVARLSLTKFVRFLGWRNDLENVFGAWQAFALPSLEEGFSVAALEAMAAGLPVVGTNVGGIPELVADGITGWLVPPRDPSSMAARLTQLLAEPKTRYRMAAAAKARAVSQFSCERMVRSISALYGSLLQ